MGEGATVGNPDPPETCGQRWQASAVSRLNGDLLDSATAPALPSDPQGGRPLIAAGDDGNTFEYDTASNTLNEFSFTPEPSTGMLLGLGGMVAGLAYSFRRSCKRP